MRPFSFVRSIDGSVMWIVQTDQRRTIASTDYQNRDIVLTALNHFATLSSTEQMRLLHDQKAQEG
jgi:hypothetical protein